MTCQILNSVLFQHDLHTLKFNGLAIGHYSREQNPPVYLQKPGVAVWRQMLAQIAHCLSQSNAAAGERERGLWLRYADAWTTAADAYAKSMTTE